METMTSNSPRRGWKKWLIVALAVVLVIAAFCFMHKKYYGINPQSEYQAVFFNNGQVYFWKLKARVHWTTLSEVYYLQVQEQLQNASNEGSAEPNSQATPATNREVKLIKLGSELHGPESEMHIKTSNILFWEDLKSDSKVVQTIKSGQ